MNMPKYLIAMDSPDPDNLALAEMAMNLYGKENIYGVLLTGRPINFDATKETSIGDWNYDHSRLALKASASRIKNFLRAYDADADDDAHVDVFDGCVAPRTLVPHWVHFLDYYKFMDYDPLRAVAVPEMDGIEKLAKKIGGEDFSVLVGGPMTGLATLLERFPPLANQVTSVHAMYGTLGEVKLMALGDKLRGAKQFNVACDPRAGKFVTEALDCPIYFITSECTRDDAIGFETPSKLSELLEDTEGNRHLLGLYNIWFANAVEPRKENLYIHDACAAISASEQGEDVYDFSQMKITEFPTMPKDEENWGTIEFKPDDDSNIHVATRLKNPKLYLDMLKKYLK